MASFGDRNPPVPEETPSASTSFTFSDFPEDVQLCILSFLTPSEIASFACTSKRFVSLCRSDSKLWFSLCDRRWGSNTNIRKWGNGQIGFMLLYKTLIRWENLIGFWRQIGQTNLSVSAPPLVFFEWGPYFITGSRVSPWKSGTYRVMKTPFLWMGLSSKGESINFLDSDCRFVSSGDFAKAAEMGDSDAELVSVNINFMGKSHFVVEENQNSSASCSPEVRKNGYRRSSSSSNLRGDDTGAMEDVIGVESTSPGSLPDHFASEIYQYFANRTSPSGDKARRQRKKERERLGRRKWESEHFVKVVNCAPTPSRPLQGLWKGICDGMRLDFYLVTYDDIGGVVCRRIVDASEPFSGYSPVFWTSNTTFIESPFSAEEEHLYDSRVHLHQLAAANHIHEHLPTIENEVVSRILYINSSYDLVIPDFTGSTDSRHVEGRIWQYENGTFGFGFLRNNFIIDLKHIALNGCLLDTMENL
ncbi:PREDICTED: F-box protein At3g12350 [Nelumbo nucifera]|uniref:F-box protein n=2 Tax=Nelumbo nucifera TaxID=4432 RepID=A0A1U8B1A1_NELNU|nr:PREDICTED: F-box protein At3g12350 [Nelumbo nucifera]DAD41525.1 TPA_asm: hypothetical protein HUJ06_015848 [Nelumbo nucifera]